MSIDLLAAVSRSIRPALAAIALASGVVAAAGCATDSYYCDATGCYFCDGVGCRTATAPSRPHCRGDFECTAGSVCTNLGCATRCNVSGDCAQGWVCRGGSGTSLDAGVRTSDASASAGASANATGLCVAPTETTPVAMPGSCTTNADCVSGTVCTNAVCTTSTTHSCAADRDCTSGHVCVAAVCVASTDTCQFDNQCGANRACVNSQCRATCSASAPCAAGSMCVTVSGSSYCAPAAVPACVHDSDCGAGRRCADGACHATCTPGATTCAASTDYCNDDGLCVTDTRPHPFCDSAHPCGSESSCVGGVCRVSCTSAADCQRTEVNYRNCSPLPTQPGDAHRYCITDNEARPTCARQSDCANGQSCIDANCR